MLQKCDAKTEDAPLEIWPIQGIPLVNAGDDIPAIVVSALKEINYEPRDGDVLVVTQSIVSIAEGKVHNLKDLLPAIESKSRYYPRSPNEY